MATGPQTAEFRQELILALWNTLTYLPEEQRSAAIAMFISRMYSGFSTWGRTPVRMYADA